MVGGEDGWVARSRLYLLLDTESNPVSSVSDRNRLNPQDVETVISNNLAPLTSLLMSFTGPKDPVVHLGGLT